MSKGYTLETILRAYNDSDGSYIEVREDQDGLDMIELLYNDGRKDVETIYFPCMDTEQAVMVAQAILQMCKTLDSKKENGEK